MQHSVLKWDSLAQSPSRTRCPLQQAHVHNFHRSTSPAMRLKPIRAQALQLSHGAPSGISLSASDSSVPLYIEEGEFYGILGPHPPCSLYLKSHSFPSLAISLSLQPF